MTLDQLRIFIAVAERQHVTRAAQALGLTQSAASAAIAALEERHAARLFDRIGRRIELTEAGRSFLAEAKAVVARAESAERVLDDFAGLRRGSLRIAASQTVANYWLPPLMHRFRAAYPAIGLQLSIGNSEQVARAVRELAADLGFIENDIDEPGLATSRIATDELALVVGAEHPWALRRSIEPHELRETPWVLRERGSGTRAMFDATLERHGLTIDDVDIALELPSNEAVRGAVAAGAGATVLSRLVVDAMMRSASLVLVGFDLPNRHFLMLRHQERFVTQAERAFAGLVTGS